MKRAFDGGVSILLISSSNSLVCDPIDWPLWKTRVQEWARLNDAIVEFPPHPLDQSLPGLLPRAVRPPQSLSSPLSLLPWLEIGRVGKLSTTLPQLEPKVTGALRELVKCNWLAVTLGVFPRSLWSCKLPEDFLLRWESAALWDFYSVWELRCRLVFKRRRFSKSLGICRHPFHDVPMLRLSGRKPCGVLISCLANLPRCELSWGDKECHAFEKDLGVNIILLFVHYLIISLSRFAAGKL